MDPPPFSPSQGRKGDDVEVRRRHDAGCLAREMDPPLSVPTRDARETMLKRHNTGRRTRDDGRRLGTKTQDDGRRYGARDEGMERRTKVRDEGMTIN